MCRALRCRSVFDSLANRLAKPQQLTTLAVKNHDSLGQTLSQNTPFFLLQILHLLGNCRSVAVANITRSDCISAQSCRSPQVQISQRVPSFFHPARLPNEQATRDQNRLVQPANLEQEMDLSPTVCLTANRFGERNHGIFSLPGWRDVFRGLTAFHDLD